MRLVPADATRPPPPRAVPRRPQEVRALLQTLERERTPVLIGGGGEAVTLLRVRDPAEALQAERPGGDPAPSVLVCDVFPLALLWPLLARGCRGAVLSRQAERALPLTLEAVLGGLICFPEPSEIVRPVLSIREKQVIGLVALGLSNAEIAERLFVVESTVKSHLTSVFAKLGVRSRHEAIDLIVNPSSGLGLGILALATDPATGEDQ
jgi:DNA-binding CsgD family transcriptional regulator